MVYFPLPESARPTQFCSKTKKEISDFIAHSLFEGVCKFDVFCMHVRLKVTLTFKVALYGL